MSRPLAAAWAPAALFAALTLGQPAAAMDAIAGTQLVMHVGPGAHHPRIGDVPAETRLTVHGCSEAEGWCLVRFAGRHGWIEGESLNVVGFSRPPQAVAAVVAPAAREPVVVPVPVAPEAVLPPFITADDVIVGMGEQFGIAAIAPGLGARPFGLKRRHGTGLAFKHDFKGGIHVRRHGDFRHPHLGKHGFHAGKAIEFDHRRFGKLRGHPGKGLHFGPSHFGKDLHVSRGHFRRDLKGSRGRFAQRGHFALHGKGLESGWHIARGPSRHHVSRGRFGKRGHFALHGKSLDRGWHIAKGHVGHHFGKGGFGRFGKSGFGGLRIKGGWRP